MMSGSSSNEPGVTTLRVPDNQQQQQQQQLRDQYVRDVDIEVCFVCKKCRAAFSGDSSLLTHQRQCFGGSLDNRGAFRIVQSGLECKLCPGERFRNLLDYRKHSEGEQHQSRAQPQLNIQTMQQNIQQQQNVQPNIQQQQQQQQQQSMQQQNMQLQLPPPSESPLSHEMEDVVNQITLLAARAAQEAGAPSPAVDSNSNTFCQPGEPKRRFLSPGDVTQPLTSAGH